VASNTQKPSLSWVFWWRFGVFWWLFGNTWRRTLEYSPLPLGHGFREAPDSGVRDMDHFRFRSRPSAQAETDRDIGIYGCHHEALARRGTVSKAWRSLLPPSETSLLATSGAISRAEGHSAITYREDRVYVASDRDAGMAFAAYWTRRSPKQPGFALSSPGGGRFVGARHGFDLISRPRVPSPDGARRGD
jgi:hypothetical protein